MADDTPGATPDDTPDDAEIGAAVDDALSDELKRQKARFVQRIMGIDRIEGVGRRDARWDEGFDGERVEDRSDDPTD